MKALRLTVPILAVLSACTVQAVVVNVDIDARTSDSSAARQGIAYSGQGAYADSGNDYWNSISTGNRSVSGLIASDGAADTALGITVSAGDGYVHTGITNYLLADYFYGTTTTTISGLDANEDYTVYVYAVGDTSGQGATVTIGSESRVTSGDNSGEFSLGGNYVVFDAAADSAGEMEIISSDKLNGLQLIGDVPDPVKNLVHPGMSHNSADLERMKYQVAAQVDPWYSSYQEMCEDSKASYDYEVQGSVTNKVVYRDSPRTNKSAFESDSRAAYYNAIRWIVEGDSRYADKAVEIFNAWCGLTYVQHSGTKTLSGSMIYVMLEAAEIIKCTYSGWTAAERQAFGDMLVYPGWSGTTVPDGLDLAYEDGGEGTWYWRVYEGDHRRAGNQEASGWRACMAIGIFLDNEIIYDRAYRYIAGMDHRADDLAYQPGPTLVDSEISTTPYNTAYNSTQYDTIEDWGYDGVLTNYVLTTGQCGEASRDQGHCQWGLNCLQSIAGMAWTQGDDLWGLADNRLLLGLEYHTRYNLSYLQSYEDQEEPWEPTPESGEFIQTLNRCRRTKCLAINPYYEYNYTNVSRGAVSGYQYELIVGHYVGRGFSDPDDEAKWIVRTRDYNISESGYEETDTGGAYIGWGGLTFRRPDYCYGDPVSNMESNVPSYAIHQLPGTIEAALYDYSQVNGNGRTFYDLSDSNSGGAFRTDGDVDLASASEGGYAVTDIEDGEWVSYTVNVATSGTYSISVRYAAGEEAAVRAAFGGSDVTGDVRLPATGGSGDWDSYTIAENIELSAGVQSLRLYFSRASDSYRFKSITLTQTESMDWPTTFIEAEDCDASSGLKLNDAGTGASAGYNIGSVSDGDWCRYDGLTLGDAAVFTARVARPSGRPDVRMEIRTGSTAGTMIGYIDVPVTGGWSEWETFSTVLDPVEGAPDLYIVFVQTDSSSPYDMMNFDYFELSVRDYAAPEVLNADAVSASVIDLAWSVADGASGYNLKRSTASGGPYEVIGISSAVTNYSDGGLSAGTNYFYVVSSLFSGSESDDSAEVSAVPSAPLSDGDVVIGSGTAVDDGEGGLNFSVAIEASELGHSYQLYTAGNLVDPDWQPAGDAVNGNGGALEIEVPVSGTDTNLFYKLEAWRR